MGVIQSMDASILYYMQNHVQNPLLNPIMIFFTKIGDMGIIWILIAIWLLCIKRFRKVGGLMLCALVINTILGEGLLKHIFQRPRPFDTLQGLHLLVPAPTSYSFPSGHTSSAFACAIVVAYFLRKWSIPAIILAAVIGFSRVYLTVHYPTDVIAGVILGCISAFITIYCYKWLRKTGRIKF